MITMEVEYSNSAESKFHSARSVDRYSLKHDGYVADADCSSQHNVVMHTDSQGREYGKSEVMG